MPLHLDVLDTIVVVMMENRSFDHMLGYLSQPPWNRKEVDGLGDEAWRAARANRSRGGKAFPPFPLTNPLLPSQDPPHGRENITVQLGAQVDGAYAMDGFVTSFEDAFGLKPPDDVPATMGYFTDREVPTTHFLAQNFALCDRWFACLPTSTRPNRLMAMSGYTRTDQTGGLTPEQHLVYDWLEAKQVRWRVYHHGFPFMGLMPRWFDFGLDPHFRRIDSLEQDLLTEKVGALPQVIFVEPGYADAKFLVSTTNDDHPACSVTPGQQLLERVYHAFAKSAHWERTLMIVTYDEHGGFFDHVSPPAVPTAPRDPADYRPFTSLGVRVPALLVSPWVDAGTVFHELLDHTSILKLIGARFGNQGYSPEVDARPVRSLAELAFRDTPRADVPMPEQPQTPSAQAFRDAAARIVAADPAAAQNHPHLVLGSRKPGGR